MTFPQAVWRAYWYHRNRITVGFVGGVRWELGRLSHSLEPAPIPRTQAEAEAWWGS